MFFVVLMLSSTGLLALQPFQRFVESLSLNFIMIKPKGTCTKSVFVSDIAYTSMLRTLGKFSCQLFSVTGLPAVPSLPPRRTTCSDPNSHGTIEWDPRRCPQAESPTVSRAVSLSAHNQLGDNEITTRRSSTTNVDSNSGTGFEA